MAEPWRRRVSAPHLIRIARRNNIRDLTVEVLGENKAMQAVINKCNCKIKRTFAGNIYSYEIQPPDSLAVASQMSPQAMYLTG